jgi:hypothetical protein
MSGRRMSARRPQLKIQKVTKILVYHDQWAAWTMHQVNQAYREDLRRLLVIVKDCRQKKLDAAQAVVKRRALKIQHKAEREEDPAKMEKIYG